MNQSNQTLGRLKGQTLWKSVFGTFRALFPMIFSIFFVGVSIPLFLLNRTLGEAAINISETNKSLLLSGESTVNVLDILNPVVQFSSNFLAMNLFAILTSLVAIFSSCFLVFSYLTQSSSPKFITCINRGLRYTFFRGTAGFIVYLFIIAIVFITTRVFSPLPTLIVAALGLAFPVLIISKDLGPIRSVTSSVTMKYAAHIPGGRWITFFQILSIAFIAFASLMGLEYLAVQTQYLDVLLSMPRETLHSNDKEFFNSIIFLSNSFLKYCGFALVNSFLTVALVTYLAMVDSIITTE